MNKALLVLVITAFSIIPVFSQKRWNIRLFTEATIKSDVIKLGDIAQISADEKSERLKQISLGYAPNVGILREIYREQVAFAITAAGISANEYSLEAPSKIVVRRASQVVAEHLLRQAVEAAIQKNMPADESVKVNILRLDVPINIEVAAGEISLQATPGGVRNLFAPFTMALEIRVDNRVVRRVSATVQLEAYADILVAKRDLAARERISEADVQLENRRLEKPLASYLRSVEKLRGAVLVKNVASEAELTTADIAAGYVVKTGDLVSIVGTSGKLQISIKGEARTNGRIGDRVSVKNPESGTILQATVVDEGLVKINF